MSVISIRIDDNRRKLLKVIASAEGRSMTSLVCQLLDEYVERKKAMLGDYSENSEMQALMKVSEAAFAEWDNAEDSVYDSL
jgi:predicted transcriptional regulator